MHVSNTSTSSSTGDTQTPTIFLVSGPLGVGKTTLTRRLAGHRQAGLIKGDALFLPLEQIPELSWDERLSMTWDNILDITTRYIDRGLDVVIDFAVQEELEWFYKQLKKHGTAFDLRYIVLHTDSKTLLERLSKRGSARQIERALSSLNKITKDPKNKPYMCYTTDRSPSELVSICLLEKFKYQP